MRKWTLRASILAILVLAGALTWAVLAQAGGKAKSPPAPVVIEGAGKTIIAGGTGPPAYQPVVTNVAFWARDGKGKFECLALGDDGTGHIDGNVMYVTGAITSARIKGDTAFLKGTSTVTGLGAGTNLPFTVMITRGGEGARVLLKVSGLTFDEIVLEGQITF